MMMGVLRGGKDGFGDATLLDIVVRDGTAAFLGVFSEYRLRFDSSSCSQSVAAVAMLLNTILFTLGPTTLVTIGFP